MDGYSIVGVAIRSILWIFLVICLLTCFFSAYRRWLRSCFLPHLRQEAVAAARYGAGVGLPERGLLDSEIEAFPKFVYPPEGGREITECVVCLAAFVEGETLRLISTCAHVFHADCVDVWLRGRATCPCCRAYLKILPAAETAYTRTESPV